MQLAPHLRGGGPGGDEPAHSVPDQEVELRGRGEPTQTWVRTC
jgi:hypothetical protein